MSEMHLRNLNPEDVSDGLQEGGEYRHEGEEQRITQNLVLERISRLSHGTYYVKRYAYGS